MLNAKTRWKIAEADENVCRLMTEKMGIPPLLARLLHVRGIQDVLEAERFLHLDSSHFHDPFQLDGMKESVKRIKEAIHHQEQILIYGDYDADGISSTSLMIHTMRQLGASFDFYIPDRFTEGYGLNKEALTKLKNEGFSLVITVDTGISAVDEVEYGKVLGLDIIITDHHEPPPVLPDAFAVINPKKPGCPYPFKMLAGVGVAFKLAHALLDDIPFHLIELAAIGTISDLVPLIDENRLLARYGLEALTNTRCPGIHALKEVCGIADQEMKADHVGFALGPRINASGRLDRADYAVELLICEDEERAKELARVLDQFNRERQLLAQQIAEEAEKIVETELLEQERSVIVVAGEGWNEGVIGIVASRLVEKYYRPSIVLSIDGETGIAKGSARSIEGFDLYKALSACKDLLPHYGGHTMAAGMSLDANDISELRARLNQLAVEWLTEEDLTPVNRIDARCHLEEISIDVIEQLQLLAPFGEGNPNPLFVVEDVGLTRLKTIGRDLNHIKCVFTKDNHILEGVGFKMADVVSHISSNAEVKVIGELAINEWNGHRKPQLIIRDLSVPHIQVFDWRDSKDKDSKLMQIAETSKNRVVFFQEKSKRRIEPYLFQGKNLSFFESDDNGNWQRVSTGGKTEDYTSLVIYDLPSSLSALESVLKKSNHPERIYCLFGEDDCGQVSRLPKREHFKWLYSLLHNQKQISFENMEKQARLKGMTKETVHFILDVFEELEFIIKGEGDCRLIDSPKKRELTDSKLYQRKKKQLELATELLYSSHRSLYQWLMKLINTNTQVEEDTIYEL